MAHPRCKMRTCVSLHATCRAKATQPYGTAVA